MSDVDNTIRRYQIEHDEKWRDWIDKIPALNFDPAWSVKVIPPFGGAMARFRVEYKGKSASVYLDVYERLGCYGEPHWEVYPVNDNNERCAMNDVPELMRMIRESIGHMPAMGEGEGK